MTYRQSHDEWEEKIIAKLAGELDPAESMVLDDHLRSCPQCVQMMKEYELLSNSMRLIKDDELEREPPTAVVELKKEITQWRILEESHRIAEEAFNKRDEKQETTPIEPEAVSGSDNQQFVLVSSCDRNGLGLPVSAPNFSGQLSRSVISISLQCYDRFFEVFTDEVESNELIIESAVSQLLCHFFDEVMVNVSMNFSPHVQMGLQHCSIQIQAHCGAPASTLLPSTKENMEVAIESSICSILRELFGSVNVDSVNFGLSSTYEQVHKVSHSDQKD